MSTTQERLDAYKAAEARILAGGQSVQFSEGGIQRQLQHADLAEIRRTIVQLGAQLQRETGYIAARAWDRPEFKRKAKVV